ncbi:S8 family serine peptidase [Bradyrhizobium sp.]|uniref:S8 family serine peptidase n=1 Tax=Bradyrhizobium sp. TaxID=376 RepID=UPI001D60F9AD|nr:S8 family serine peptidase [Bradyrhizobium sp.]MBI5318871.1 S8 family serine peptidase [Bradyrhizobium sp.]
MIARVIKRRMQAGCAAVALIAAAVPLAWLDMPQASAQAMMRPNLNIAPRIPTINPTVTPRVDTNVAARPNMVTGVDRATPHVTPTTTPIMRTRVNPNSTMPYARYSPNLYPACDAANRDAAGACQGTPSASGGEGNGGKSAKGKGKGKGPNSPVATVSLNFPNELVAEIDGSMSEEQVRALAQRYGMVLVESQNLPLIGATIGLFRITNGRLLDAARRDFATHGSVRGVQFNMRYWLQEKPLGEGDPAQYAVSKLKLPQAHRLAHGMNVTIAVIDSGIDAGHPELANSISDNFDALGSKEGAHVHGTGIAGAIAAHGRLMGSAPEARIIAIRAFGSAPGGAESSSYVIIKALNYAVLHGAQIINMSFAGPKDLLIERGIAATAARDVVLVAAAGNAGPKSPPLFPAANPNVIAVSGTDAQDRLFAASNRGVHIALAAPGTDIFLPAPDQKYQMTSGTSFSAAYVSGIAALLLERNPALKPSEVRAILTATARDLGVPGRDELFGYGQADAFAATTAATAAPSVPVATAPRKPGEPADNDVSVSRELKVPSAAMASDKSASDEPNRPAAQ